MTKRKKTSEIEGREARFSNMVTVISLITLVFTSRGMKKDDIAKKVARIRSKTTGIGPKWAKILKRNF